MPQFGAYDQQMKINEGPCKGDIKSVHLHATAISTHRPATSLLHIPEHMKTTVVAHKQNARRFPLELEIIIILSLGKNRPFLAKCSLVCRDWQLTVRNHLFSNITIPSSEIQRLVDFSFSCPENSFKRCLSALKITGRLGRPTRPRTDEPLGLYIEPGDGLRSSTFQSVVHLSIINVIFQNIWSLIDIVTQFGALETLFIRYLLHPAGSKPFHFLDQSPANAPVPVDRFPKGLKSISINASRNLGYLYTLVIALVPQADRYRFYGIRSCDLPHLRDYIATAGRRGPERQEWELEFSESSIPSRALMDYINFPRDNNNIVCLRLGGVLNWEGITTLFKSVKVSQAGKLKYIVLPKIRLQYPEYRQYLTELHSAFLSSYFDGLKQVRFLVSADQSEKEESFREFDDLLKSCQKGRIFKPEYEHV
ncbi:hypothetical protein L218DRAFT_1008659 [Marasmius fiardii PR-910]|nr:hypothetical protein L218DRAFT_1008659 [Marasmius fiardii PR-910]